MTTGEALDLARISLAETASPRLDADRLVAHTLATSPSNLILQEDVEFSETQATWFLTALKRRVAGEPLAYIVQSQGFFKHDFFVKEGVLIPRPETELIVEEALRLFQKAPTCFADLGCGSGCIGLSLLHEWPTARLTALDFSPNAVQVTNENACRLGVLDRSKIVQGKLPEWRSSEKFDLVVANPPYVAHDDTRVEANVRKFEPAAAVFSGPDGFEQIFSWSEWAFEELKPRGWWIVEIGTGQSPRVEAKLFELGFSDVAVKKDLAGHLRTVLAKKP